jgi:hypothetical protein
MKHYNRGWRQESERHSLARRGVKTGRQVRPFMYGCYDVAPFPITKKCEGCPLYCAGKCGCPRVDCSKCVHASGCLCAKGFRANADDRMHAKMFSADSARVSDKLTPDKVNYLIKDEHKATKEYDDLGLESLSHDEARHEYLLKSLEKENKMPLAAKGVDRQRIVANAKKLLSKSTFMQRFNAALIGGENVEPVDYKIRVKQLVGSGYSEGDAKIVAKAVQLKQYNDTVEKWIREKERRKGLRVDKRIIKETEKMLHAKGQRIHTAKFRRCVKEVSKKSKGKVNPFAACEASIGYEGSVLPSHRRRQGMIPLRKSKSEDWRRVI